MTAFQILATIAFGVALVHTALGLRSRATGRRVGVAWIAVWLAGILVVCFPDLTIPVARFLGIRRGADAVLYTSVAVLAYAMFRLYVALETQNQVITRLVSELALRVPLSESDESKAAVDEDHELEA